MASLLETVLSKKASLSCQFAPNLPAVRADSSQIRQVIMNLITNASDALGEEVGEIHVATHVIEADRNFISQMYLNDNLNEGAYVCLEVRDSGCGMNIETLSRIFDPFFSTKFTGRGLGLAAVLGIVRSHGGGLSVWSSPSEGTTFKVLFPISELDPESVAERSCSSSLPITKVGEVLVVDDEDAARSVTRAMLEHFGFRVTEACDGVEALEVFKERGSDSFFVLLDMTMPRMDKMRPTRTPLPPGGICQ